MPVSSKALARIEMIAADDNSEFILHSRTEIVFVLRSVMHRRELVTAYYDDGGGFILTSILDVRPDAGEVILDWGGDEARNHKLLRSERISFGTAQDKVKVQFRAAGAGKLMFEGAPAFRIALPAELVRLQRREYYRLTTPVSRPVKCVIEEPQEAGGSKVEETVLDISGGGIAMLDYRPDAKVVVGEVLRDCRLDLPGVGTINVALQIANVFRVTLPNGARCIRAGCQFIEVTPAARSMVQRYVLQLERERNARLTGLE